MVKVRIQISPQLLWLVHFIQELDLLENKTFSESILWLVNWTTNFFLIGSFGSVDDISKVVEYQLSIFLFSTKTNIYKKNILDGAFQTRSCAISLQWALHKNYNNGTKEIISTNSSYLSIE